MILGDFLKALGQTGDPRFRRVLWLGLGLSVALLFGVYAAFLGLVNWVAPDTVLLPYFGEVAWVDDLLSFASIALMLVLSVVLMMPVASLFTGLFLEDVAAAVEAKHYPELPPVPRIPWRDVLADTLSFFCLLVGVNVVAFVLAIVFAPFAPFIFYAVNGFLLGREYFQIAAMRRVGRQGAREIYRANVLPIWIAGMLMAVPLSVPLLNLIIPILGAATFTHMFHRLSRNRSG
ncbi:EI24 domain-containing protein [Psychromarinibacter sp. C21-152]|uniref:EI24 domain-containing protein n=1 Tax=Psychromarinibacter sediminicola TaxID=3033385 RepID=A0AAE3NMU3_9RHOB|nr:EI24 domain-containing protein [Psychromarinibacter sediminicola]MDF0599179.1 EI24 domain-containing protein [Psychromarinibacter sediminicola]